eukprot:CAMPEP_0181218610 /NCGR_PEP_ID=MMETSP1096-20121128/27790_1 /TAXON_ID=156174 ORGANISM="Chrysochromulina ericina, Strain CCMP281" /NCGR_SAMPLE_ID=MMETSP1096 /ASSEMBLY_ACC=CAM_ASM_000453 /LENGTH=83 /DNA_ID=CAMNT_0023310847 /DNA_START=1030 /DNA_END=1278 /DNA_ORIENTATION=+
MGRQPRLPCAYLCGIDCGSVGGDVGDESRVDQLQLVFKLLQPFVCVGREHVDAALVLPRRPLHKLHATTLQEFVQVGRTAHYA